MKKTAAITSACNSSAYLAWNVWACTAAGPISFDNPATLMNEVPTPVLGGPFG